MASEILPNPKHEKFAQAIAEGKTNAEAYSASGYKVNGSNSANALGSKLLRKVTVRDRVYSIRTAQFDEALKIAGYSKSMVLKMLVENAQNAMKLTPKGKPAATYNQAAANRALELIGKEAGMFVDRTDARVTVKSIADLPDSDLTAILAQAAEAQKRKEQVQ